MEKSPQLIALKTAERFIKAELATREASYLPAPTASESFDLQDVRDALRIVQAALVDGKIAAAPVAAIRSNSTKEPLVSAERQSAIRSFREALSRIEEAYGLRLKATVDCTGDLLIVDTVQTLPGDYLWSAIITDDGELEIAEYVLDDESGMGTVPQ